MRAVTLLHFDDCQLLCSFQFVSSRRHTPYGNQTDYRIYELNKRLQNWTEVCVHTQPHTLTLNAPKKVFNG